MPLSEIPDAVFAQAMLGDGVAIDPLSRELRAPCDGEVISIAAARHAVALRATSGAEILVHVGVDTVGLDRVIVHGGPLWETPFVIPQSGLRNAARAVKAFMWRSYRFMRRTPLR